jgi:hypothetical protein
VSGGGSSTITFTQTHIAQSDIDNGNFTPDQLFQLGDFLFAHDFLLQEGFGNALTTAPAGTRPRPNERRVQYGDFGGPDATSCVSCHNVARVAGNEVGDDGAGDVVSDEFQDGDGLTLSSALERQPPQVIGTGFLQQLAIEMTADLSAQVANGAALARSTNRAQTVSLHSKNVGFGSVVIAPNGLMTTTGLEGIDPDLVVKPFGWKGHVPNLRRFAEGAFQVHHNMQPETLIVANCQSPTPNLVGNGPDCEDPDGDGVHNEITEGQLTIMAVYSALLQVPVQIFPTDQAAIQRVDNGQLLFMQVGCAICHVPTLTLNSTTHVERPDLTGGAGITFDLINDGRPPQALRNFDGTVSVALYSDLKRHDLGPELADPRQQFPTIPASQWLTRPLWGVGATAPYLHDGRAQSIVDAVAAHGGEAATARAAFQALVADQQAQIVEFLQTLTRDPNQLKN